MRINLTPPKANVYICVPHPSVSGGGDDLNEQVGDGFKPPTNHI